MADAPAELEPGKALYEDHEEKVGAVIDRDDRGAGKVRVKSGELIRIVDSLSAEERLAIEQLRSFGPYKLHDARAQFLEELAGAARKQANAILIADRYPFLESGDTRSQPQPLAIKLILGSVIVLCASIAIYAQVRAPSPTPSVVAETTAPPAPERPKRALRTQKGRVDAYAY